MRQIGSVIKMRHRVHNVLAHTHDTEAVERLRTHTYKYVRTWTARSAVTTHRTYIADDLLHFQH